MSITKRHLQIKFHTMLRHNNSPISTSLLLWLIISSNCQNNTLGTLLWLIWRGCGTHQTKEFEKSNTMGHHVRMNDFSLQGCALIHLDLKSQQPLVQFFSFLTACCCQWHKWHCLEITVFSVIPWPRPWNISICRLFMAELHLFYCRSILHLVTVNTPRKWK